MAQPAEARPAKPEEDDDASDEEPTTTGDPAADAAAAEARRIKNAKKKAKKKAAKAAAKAEGEAGARRLELRRHPVHTRPPAQAHQPTDTFSVPPLVRRR